MNAPPTANAKAPTDSQPQAAGGMNITNPPAQTQTQTHECEHKRQAMRLRGGGAGKDCFLGLIGCFLCFECCEILPELNSDSCFHGIFVAREPYKSVWSRPPVPASKNRTFATVREDWEKSGATLRKVISFRRSVP
ncbi:hypothetical protein ARMGADRAFT_1075799 [Armillaria gallica]|uniref:Cysteine-rich transmembrane CYSTM domain-containing protein n=1 Tax=Armillaria gallica TaxID=47427 RepID=A0A2H3DT97_ARMGA|nr:hypothetical protein ARMGADRAFT_1075799 [Armillaria gallica]